jgi:hypothetical protein
MRAVATILREACMVTMDDRTKLREARRVISTMIRVCRQTVTFLDGVSCLDQMRLKKLLRDSLKDADEYMRIE